jgi:hypothetical protein
MAHKYELAQNLTMNGSWIDGATTLFDTALGPWWKIFLFTFLIFATYITTKNEGATAAVSILGAAFLSYHLGSAVPVWIHGIIYLIAALCLAMTLFKAMGRGE